MNLTSLYLTPCLPHHLLSLFLSIVSVSTPINPQRTILLKFKDTTARNDMLCGLRKMMADAQIFAGREGGQGEQEGIMSPFRNVSPNRSIFTKKGVTPGKALKKKARKVYGSGGSGGALTMVLLSDVHAQLSRERGKLERVMVQMMQGSHDLSQAESQLAKMRLKMLEVSGKLMESEGNDEKDKLLSLISRKLQSVLMESQEVKEERDALIKERDRLKGEIDESRVTKLDATNEF